MIKVSIALILCHTVDMRAWPAQSDQLLIKPKLLLKKIVDFSFWCQTKLVWHHKEKLMHIATFISANSDNKFVPQNLISQRNRSIFAPEQSLASKHEQRFVAVSKITRSG